MGDAIAIWTRGSSATRRACPTSKSSCDSTAKQWSLPLFITGDPEWGDYTVEAKVKPLSLKDMAGLVFRYHTNRHYYLFSLADGAKARLAVLQPIERALRQPVWRELAAVPFLYDNTRYYTLKVENQGPRIRAYIDGKLVLEASDQEILKGKAGVAGRHARALPGFPRQRVRLRHCGIRPASRARDAELAELRDDNPKPKLWKKFDTPEVRRRPQRAFRRPRWRPRPRHADRAEHPAHPRQTPSTRSAASPRSRSTAASCGSPAGPTRAMAS